MDVLSGLEGYGVVGAIKLILMVRRKRSLQGLPNPYIYDVLPIHYSGNVASPVRVFKIWKADSTFHFEFC